jgi:hypothetical protein
MYANVVPKTILISKRFQFKNLDNIVMSKCFAELEIRLCYEQNKILCQ